MGNETAYFLIGNCLILNTIFIVVPSKNEEQHSTNNVYTSNAGGVRIIEVCRTSSSEERRRADANNIQNAINEGFIYVSVISNRDSGCSSLLFSKNR